MIASERWTRRVCCFNFLLVRLWHHQFTTIDEYYCAFAYAGGRMIPSAPALPPPPVRYLESLAVSCHVRVLRSAASSSSSPRISGLCRPVAAAVPAAGETWKPVRLSLFWKKKTIRQNLPSSPSLQLRLRSYFTLRLHRPILFFCQLGKQLRMLL